MNRSIILKSESSREAAIAMLSGVPTTPLHIVTVKEHKRDRSSAQNSLMWSWLTVIGNEIGESKDSIHEIYKRMFLLDLFVEYDDGTRPSIKGYREMWEAISSVEDDTARKQMVDFLISQISTTRADVEIMSVYLNKIERNANSQGIILPHPEDSYYLAMGRY
jgi:hypothetical protein